MIGSLALYIITGVAFFALLAGLVVAGYKIRDNTKQIKNVQVEQQVVNKKADKALKNSIYILCLDIGHGKVQCRQLTTGQIQSLPETKEEARRLIRGLPGKKGAKGGPGGTGPAGSTGPAGARGTAGANGARGERGANGANGQNGSDGAQGPRGPRGFPGARGPQGNRGPVGPQGARGPAGPPGTCPHTAVIRVLPAGAITPNSTVTITVCVP